MRVSVDPTKCQGHGQCVLTCPELFEADEQGFASLKQREVPAALEEKAQRAELRCPERAVTVER